MIMIIIVNMIMILILVMIKIIIIIITSIIIIIIKRGVKGFVRIAYGGLNETLKVGLR